jgi:hypothetical protein
VSQVGKRPSGARGIGQLQGEAPALRLSRGRPGYCDKRQHDRSSHPPDPLVRRPPV